MLKWKSHVCFGLLLLSACQAGPTIGPSSSPARAPLPQTSASSQLPAIPLPSQAPVSVLPAPASSLLASPSDTPQPAPTITPDLSVFEFTEMRGFVFDDHQHPLSKVSIRVKSLNDVYPFQASALTGADGAYTVKACPTGITLEVEASLPGFTQRRRVEVLSLFHEGPNRYDFGTDGSTLSAFGTPFNSLSDKPEVTSVTPGRNASGISPATGFKLTFSEPVERATIEANFEIRAFNSKRLSVDDAMGLDPTAITLRGSSTPYLTSVPSGTPVWDKTAFDISWNSNDTEATFRFKDQRYLPTDKDSVKTPDYSVDLNHSDGMIRDKSGIQRSTPDGQFKLTDGSFEKGFKFAIASDIVPPMLSGIKAETAEHKGPEGDSLRVTFSERMVHFTLGPTITGGMDNPGFSEASQPVIPINPGNSAEAAGALNFVTSGSTGEAVAQNYKLTVLRAGTALYQQLSWAALGGSVLFDPGDPTGKTVVLLPPAGFPSQPVAGSPAGKPITLTLHYRDDSSESFSTPETDNSVAGLLARLNAYLDPQGGRFSLSLSGEPSDTGSFALGKSYILALGAGARKDDGKPGSATGKPVAWVVVAPTGAFGEKALNAPPLAKIVPGLTAGETPDLFQPGDIVTVTAAPTIVDPAGNPLGTDSLGNQVQAVAD